MSWCPICGPEVETDGDDCCKYCGATARGEGASFALKLREENARLVWVIKAAHGALTDAATVVVPGALDGDLKPAIRQITRERNEARAELASLIAQITHDPATCHVCQGVRK